MASVGGVFTGDGIDALLPPDADRPTAGYAALSALPVFVGIPGPA